MRWFMALKSSQIASITPLASLIKADVMGPRAGARQKVSHCGLHPLAVTGNRTNSKVGHYNKKKKRGKVMHMDNLDHKMGQTNADTNVHTKDILQQERQPQKRSQTRKTLPWRHSYRLEILKYQKDNRESPTHMKLYRKRA